MEKFPRDINFNIFSRLSLKSVIQSSVVSKSWLDIIKDPCFAKLHTSLSKPDPTQLIMARRTYGEHNIISLTPVKYKGSLLITDETPIDHVVSALPWVFVGTCNGLLCFTSLYNEEEITMICNPITREHIFLPKPSIHFDKYTPTLAFGFDIASKSYKVVRILLAYHTTNEWVHRRYRARADESSSAHVKIEVFTLGDNSSWREVQVENYLPSGDPVYINGCLYWSARNLDYKVLSFDLETETFKLVPSPNFGTVSSVREVRGCLSVIDLSVDFVEIWMLKDNKNYSWEFALKIPTRNYRPAAMIKSMLIDVHEHDGFVVTWLKNELFAYDKRTFSYRVVKLKGFPVWLDWEVHGGYRGSLVTLENLGAVSEDQKGLVRFVSEDEMTCHLLANGDDFSAQKEPSGDCAALVASFKKHGMLL